MKADNDQLIRDMYLQGFPYEEICKATGANKNKVQRIANEMVRDQQVNHANYKEDRLLRAEQMEVAIFKMIKEKKDVSKYIAPFSSYCA